jgi:putative transposase
MLKRGILRPHLRRLERLQREASRLDALCARRGDPYCDMAGRAKSKLWRLLREWEVRTAKELVWLARKREAAIVIDTPNSESIQKLKQDNKYPAEKKVLLNFGRLRKLIRRLATWYGIPCIETRLYSSICPKCEARMLELQDRRVRCTKCGLETSRDEVPAMWAMKRFDELLETAKSQSPSFSSPEMLIAVRFNLTHG